MTYAVLSSKAPSKCIDKLKSLGYTILLLPPFKRLCGPVDTHADMLFFSYNNYILTHREYYKETKDIFDRLSLERDIKLILSDDDIEAEYPRDIVFNAIMLGGKLYSNTPYTSTAILELCKDTVKVAQGYAACSTLALSDKCVITADRSLAREYKKNGIEVNLISSGSISLPPYDCGFIGGATGVDGNTVYFCGDIDTHKDSNVIKAAIEQNGMKYTSLSDEPLSDVGGIKFF